MDESLNHAIRRLHQVIEEAALEYSRTKQSLRSTMNRAELLRGSSRSDSVRPRTETLLTEKKSIHQSIQMADDLLNNSYTARSQLTQQRGLFGHISSKVGLVGEKFPIVNKLIGDISKQKNKDNIVLATVMASCMLFTFLYVLNK